MRADPKDSVLAGVFREAMRIAEQMKADGASRADRDAYVADVLKASWPKGREEPWHYQCQWCDDCGWRIKTCANHACGRPFSFPKQASDDNTGRGICGDRHTYAEPCHCAKGQAYKRQLWKEPRPLEDAVAVAAKTTKPTKVGR